MTSKNQPTNVNNNNNNVNINIENPVLKSKNWLIKALVSGIITIAVTISVYYWKKQMDEKGKSSIELQHSNPINFK